MSRADVRKAPAFTPETRLVACYLRVSTGKQAESDLSIPDQRRQIEDYCASRGWTMVEDYVEPGSSATDDRRPAFQAMIDAALATPPAFNVILVHSFSRFFRDQFQFERYARKLAKNGVQIVSITQDMGDSPMGTMLRQIVTLFDEYQSKENAKHTLRAMCENARQGYWNGARPPIGYRVVEVGKRGAKIKKALEIDPLHAGTVRLIYRLAREGTGNSGPMGLKAIVCFLNERDIRTRNGGRWGKGAVHQILTSTTYIGQHQFNRRDVRARQWKAETEYAVMTVPPLIPEEEFHEVRRQLRARSPAMMPPRAVGGSTLLTGICFCAACGGAMTLRTGTSKAGRSYRYYTCSTKARQGPSGCKGVSVRMDRLDDAAVAFLLSELLGPERLETMMAPLLVHRDAWADRRRTHVIELRERAADAETKLRRLYEAVENGGLVATDRMFRERVAELGAIRDQAEANAERIAGMVDRTGPTVTALDLHCIAADARTKLHGEKGGARRALVRSLLQRIEVADKHRARVLGYREALLKALAIASGTKLARAGFGGSGEPDDRYDFPLTL